MMPVRFFVTVLIGIVGALLFLKMKVPAGAMVGAIVFVGIFQITSDMGYFPRIIKVAVQAIAGGFIGQRITAADVRQMKQIIKPALQLFLGIVCLSVCTGLLIYHFAPVDIQTALLSSMPGGVTDIALISADLGANPAQSTALQLVRYLIAILILPQVNMRICARHDTASDPAGSGEVPSKAPKGNRRQMLTTLVIIAAASILGKLSGFPAGALVFPMLAVAAYNIRTGKAYLPKPMKLAAQCCAGINIGVTVTLQEILLFRVLALPAVLVAINCILVNYLLAFLIYKTNKEIDLATALFACVPAGLSDMALISLEQGGDAPKVAVLQLVRYLCVMAFMPSLIRLFTLWYPF